MSNLVVLKRLQNEDIPFTSSKVIAEGTKVQHKNIIELIQTHQKRLEKFGILTFKTEEINGRGQPEKYYELNEQQATLLVTFMKNTEIVADFKTELVRQFFAMKQLISMRQNEEWKQIRLETKKTRLELSDVIKALPESPHKRFKYNQYTDLIYKTIFDKNSKQLREQYGIAKGKSVRDFFTPDELNHVTKLESQVATLIDLGLEYKTIQETLVKKYSISKVLNFQCAATTTTIAQT